MSINQLILDQHKPWCDIRVNSIQTDSSLGKKFTGIITFGSAVNNVDVKYRAYKNGNQVILNLEKLDVPSIGDGFIEGTPDQNFIDNLLPNGDSKIAVSCCTVSENNNDLLGVIRIDNSDIIVGVQYNLIPDSLDTSSLSNFYNDLKNSNNSSIDYRLFNSTPGLNIGWPSDINMIYFLNQ